MCMSVCVYIYTHTHLFRALPSRGKVEYTDAVTGDAHVASFVNNGVSDG